MIVRYFVIFLQMSDILCNVFSSSHICKTFLISDNVKYSTVFVE